MSRTSRDPASGAVVHEMSPENRARYERMKNGSAHHGTRSDPWGWADADPKDVWPGRRDSYKRGLYPPRAEDQ